MILFWVDQRIQDKRFISMKGELKSISTNIAPNTLGNKFDFNIFNSDDVLRSLPPELNVNLN